MSIFDLFKKLEAEKTPQAGPPEWLIVGLGNPGSKYECTRHNIGFLALETLAGIHRIPIGKLKFQALFGQGTIAGKSVLLLKPQTYMNASGNAVREAAAFYNIPPERVLVLYDDVSMTPGKLRIRANHFSAGERALSPHQTRGGISSASGLRSRRLGARYLQQRGAGNPRPVHRPCLCRGLGDPDPGLYPRRKSIQRFIEV